MKQTLYTLTCCEEYENGKIMERIRNKADEKSYISISYASYYLENKITKKYGKNNFLGKAIKGTAIKQNHVLCFFASHSNNSLFSHHCFFIINLEKLNVAKITGNCCVCYIFGDIL